MGFEIGFDPAFALWLLAPAGALLAILAVLVGRGRPLAIALRLAAAGAILLALMDPYLLREEREALPDIALLVVDESESQELGARREQTERARKAIQERLEREDALELRTLRVGPSNPFAEGAQGGGTRLFSALSEALGDIPPERLAGTLLLTDGQVHDAERAAGLGQSAPVHAFLTGSREESDRRLKVLEAPAYALIGKPVPVKIVVADEGPSAGREARVTVRIDGETREVRMVPVGAETVFEITLGHGGVNVVEIEAEPAEGELSLRNNKAVIAANGVRDRLKVLLVSGEPYAGERIWRNLLKSDPSVDLVHFTILRPPNKYDGTPIRELALIDFPKHELFSRKLYDFDLIIFDRYRLRNTLTRAYFQNIARYVENGGALLAVAGPGFASSTSLYYTPLARIFPSRPSGRIREKGFRPHLTDPGARHPVTADLPGGGLEPDWGRWFRVVETETLAGRVLMEGANAAPLLVLDRIGEGRVAQLLSDHAWLWARGFEGGGPQAELLRRLAHWLMKEPDLEEEALRARAEGRQLVIERRTMETAVPEARIEGPEEFAQDLTLEPAGPGRWRGTVETSEIGIYRVENGAHRAVAAVGPVNPAEFADMRATEAHLAPVVEAASGHLFWLEDFESAGAPDIRLVRPGRDRSGPGWAGLHRNAASLVTDRERVPLLPPLMALLLCLGTLFAAWRIEGR